MCDYNQDGRIDWETELNHANRTCLYRHTENMCLHCIYNGFMPPRIAEQKRRRDERMKKMKEKQTKMLNQENPFY